MDKVFYLESEEIQSQQAPKYSLLVEISADSFRYALTDRMHDEIKTVADFAVPEGLDLSDVLQIVSELPENDRLFKFNFFRTKIAVTTSRYTLVPDELYDQAGLRNYGKFTGAGEDDVIDAKLIRSGIRNVSAFSQELIHQIQSVFPGAQIYNQAQPTIEAALSLSKAGEPIIYADVRKANLQICAVDKGLRLYNVFDFENPDEAAYYLLSVRSQLGEHNSNAPLVLSGNISEDDYLYPAFSQLFTDIRFADASLILALSAKLQGMSNSKYFSLIALELCE